MQGVFVSQLPQSLCKLPVPSDFSFHFKTIFVSSGRGSDFLKNRLKQRNPRQDSDAKFH